MTENLTDRIAPPADGRRLSDLICPWCFVAKRRVEKAYADSAKVRAALEALGWG
jgi:hypothetical protein